MTEATHVSAVGRITPGCLGLYTPGHQAMLTRLAAVITMGGAVPGMQIAHAGRKASSQRPWEGGGSISIADGGWQTVAPSALKFTESAVTVPHAMSVAEIAEVIGEFRTSARMAREAGFKIIEVHAAHGYLMHQFLSPLSNTRNDQYGGDLAGRARALMECIDAIREEWPDELPLFVRVSATDWMAGGITSEDTVALCKMLKATGKVDLIDVSTGGILAVGPVIPALYPGYQVPYAEAVRHQADIPVGAVGLITSPEHAEAILQNERADLIFVARAVLVDTVWPLRAAVALGAELDVPNQYLRSGFGKH
jgi:2,4-dienoyl-CoA reductase-like NADH-dependent reductase (Old Yellow Enzyme family)